jgi:hypothetical protein
MFDDDEAAFADADWVQLNQFREVSVRVPFDVARTLTFDLTAFGDLGEGNLVGTHVKFKGGMIVLGFDGRCDELPLQPTVGLIIAHHHDRVVLGLEAEEGLIFLGWLNISDIHFINFISPEFNRWIH